MYLQGSILFLVSPVFNTVPCICRVQYCSLYLHGSKLFLVSPGFNTVTWISRVQYCFLYLQGSMLFLVSLGFNAVPCISRVQYCSLYLQGSILLIESPGLFLLCSVLFLISLWFRSSLYFIFHISLLIPYISGTLHPAETTYLWQIGQFVEKTTTKNER